MPFIGLATDKKLKSSAGVLSLGGDMFRYSLLIQLWTMIRMSFS